MTMSNRLDVKRLLGMVMGFAYFTLIVGVIVRPQSYAFFVCCYGGLFGLYLLSCLANYQFRMNGRGKLHLTIPPTGKEDGRHLLKFMLGLFAAFVMTGVLLSPVRTPPPPHLDMAEPRAMLLHPGFFVGLLAAIQLATGSLMSLILKVGSFEVFEGGYSRGIFQFISWKEVLNARVGNKPEEFILTLGDNSTQPTVDRTFRIPAESRDKFVRRMKLLIEKYGDAELRNRMKLGYPPAGRPLERQTLAG